MSDHGRAALLAITAVKAETRAVLGALTRPSRALVPGFPAWSGLAGARTVVLVQSGIGPARAAAALAASGTAFDAVVTLGFAGGLADTVLAGDVVLPETIVWEADGRVERYQVSTAVWQRAYAKLTDLRSVTTHRGALLSSPIVVASPAAKRAAAERFGAVAVEMESAAIVAGTRDRDVPLLALRVVLDQVDVSLESLPADLDSSWSARARLIGRPTAWPIVARLAREIPGATRTLTAAVATVLPAL